LDCRIDHSNPDTALYLKPWVFSFPAADRGNVEDAEKIA